MRGAAAGVLRRASKHRRRAAAAGGRFRGSLAGVAWVETVCPRPSVVAMTTAAIAPACARLETANGAFVVGVGGTFTIAANQPAGLYTADFDLTAEYE